MGCKPSGYRNLNLRNLRLLPPICVVCGFIPDNLRNLLSYDRRRVTSSTIFGACFPSDPPKRVYATLPRWPPARVLRKDENGRLGLPAATAPPHAKLMALISVVRSEWKVHLKRSASNPILEELTAEQISGCDSKPRMRPCSTALKLASLTRLEEPSQDSLIGAIRIEAGQGEAHPALPIDDDRARNRVDLETAPWVRIKQDG